MKSKEPFSALITGGSRGIGYAIAEAMASKGIEIFLVSQNSERLQEAKSSIYAQTNITATTFAANLGIESEVNQLATHCIESGTVPNYLILNAGIFLEGSLVNSTPKAYKQTLDVNLHSIYHLVRQLAPHMKSKNKPRIIIIGSTAAYEAYPTGALYGVAKWALRGYAINLRKELMLQGIGVTLISPGGTLTDLWEGEILPPKRLLEPRDIGLLVASLTELSDQAVVEELVIRPILGDMHE